MVGRMQIRTDYVNHADISDTLKKDNSDISDTNRGAPRADCIALSLIVLDNRGVAYLYRVTVGRCM